MFDESDKRLCKNPLYENTNLGHMVAHLECLKLISIRMRLKEQICVHMHMFGIGLNFFVSSLFILLLVNETQCLFKYMGTLAAMIDNENNYYVIFIYLFYFFILIGYIGKATRYGFCTLFLTEAIERGLETIFLKLADLLFCLAVKMLHPYLTILFTLIWIKMRPC